MNGKTGLLKFIYLLSVISIVAVVLTACSSKAGNGDEATGTVSPTAKAATGQQPYEKIQAASDTSGAQTIDTRHDNETGTQKGVAGQDNGKPDSADPKVTNRTTDQPVNTNVSQTGNAGKNGENSSSVHISITGPDKAAAILKETAVGFNEGDTVLDILRKITKEKKIQMECRGAKSFAYVRGIANVYEFDYGAESGWLYKVNGKVINVGAGEYQIKKGDIIEWVYNVEMGKEFAAGIGG